MFAARHELKTGVTGVLQRFKFVHFVKDGEFEEIKEFRTSIEQTYGIKVELFGPDFKAELERLINEQGVKAVIMGNRVTDPYSSKLSPIEASSPGWP